MEQRGRRVMSDRDFLVESGWTQTDSGWINRRVAPFAAPMSLSDAATVQRFINKLDKEPDDKPVEYTINRARVACPECWREIVVNADWCEVNGWPKCCGGKMEVVEG